jgi:hypothetical protein
MSHDTPRSARTEQLWILALALLAVAGSVVLQPSQDGGLSAYLPVIRARVSVPETCFWSRFFGISCPGCGLTRSFVHIARGDLRTAVQWNIMGPVVFLICLLQIPYRIIEYLGVWQSRPFWKRIKGGFIVVLWFIVAGLVGAWMVQTVWSVPQWGL